MKAQDEYLAILCHPDGKVTQFKDLSYLVLSGKKRKEVAELHALKHNMDCCSFILFGFKPSQMRMGLPDIKSPALSQLFCSMFDDLNFPECLWHLRSGQWMKLAWLIQAYTVGHQGAKKDNPSSKTKVFPYWKKISTKFWFCLWLKGYKQNSPCP